MQGLLLQLSALDADAEHAVRVIGFFDQLVADRVSVETLLRMTAALAECPVGITASARGLSLRAKPDGTPEAGEAPPSARVRELPDGTVVWLHRTGSPLPLDEMLLERFAITAAILLNHARLPLPDLGDPALVELALSEDAGEAERSRALHLMELNPASPVRVIAIAITTDTTAIADVVTALGGRAAGIRHAPLGTVHATLVTGPEPVPPQLPAGTRLGIGPVSPAIDAPRAWRQARIALRFATDCDPVSRSDELGAAVVLAERIRAEDIAGLPDVVALDRLVAEPTGPDTLLILDALCAQDSVRKAAVAVHRHHSTVAARLTHAETVLGFGVTSPAGRFRLKLALVLRHLRDSA
jgi:hypothetical protein